MRFLCLIPVLISITPTVAAASEHLHDSEVKSGLPQLDPNYFAPQLFWLAISFTVLYLLMSRLALPRIAAVLEDRSKRVADDLDLAEENRKRIDIIKTEIAALTKQAESDAKARMAIMHRQVNDLIRTRSDKMTITLEARVTEAESRLTKARLEVRNLVAIIAAPTAAAIVARLTGTEPKAERVEQAIRTALPDGGGHG
ncbi:MAG: hypothetical protein U9N14_04105 [Pseudomonadota bacterium]|nr:hypothetical protein [Pseudomonadota bacterium]